MGCGRRRKAGRSGGGKGERTGQIGWKGKEGRDWDRRVLENSCSLSKEKDCLRNAAASD